MTPTPMTYLDLYEPGTIVRLKNGTVFTAGTFWPELPGVDLMDDGRRLLTVGEQWLKDNVESIRFPAEPPKRSAPAEQRYKRRPVQYIDGSF